MLRHTVILPTWLALSLTFVSMVGSAASCYYNENKTSAVGIATLQAHFTDQDKRMDRIENKVDRLLEWAFGKQK